jgi:virginiamycin B lyase
MLSALSVAAALLLLAGLAPAWAGGSNYGITPGARPDLQGKISEWPVPTPRFARDPAPAPDGNVYISVMNGNKIARFDTASKTFKEWDLPSGAQPHGLLVDKGGMVWYTGHGNGTIGRLDPATGQVTQFKAPSGGDPHTLVIDDAQATIWFTVNGGNRIGRLDTKSGTITEFKVSGRPYGLALDKAGNVWFCEIYGDKLGKLDPRTGAITEVATGPGSQPRRVAAAPDGTLWVTLYGAGKLIHVDPAAGHVMKEYLMPAGATGGPYAVSVDGAGIVWANEIQTDTVARFDPKTEKFRVFQLPSKGVGIRKLAVDAQGRLWYMGSHNGRLGVIE